MTPQEQANRDLAGKFWHYTAIGDRTRLLGILTDDCVFKIGVGQSEKIVPYHGTFTGLAEIGTYLDKARADRLREECKHDSLVPGETAKSFKHQADPDGLMVHGNSVVGMGVIHDLFADRTEMHTSDFILILRIDEQQQKVNFFQIFFDTAAVAFAWLHKKS
jgi:hypothetical protein